MPTELTTTRRLALLLTWVLFVLGTLIALDATTGRTETGQPLSSGALPPEVAAVESGPTEDSPPHGEQRPGVPVAIDIPFTSSHHPHGVHAVVQSDALNPDGTLLVPSDPQVVSWARQDAAPGSTRGTVILTSHVNYVIHGRTVPGAMADLAQYARMSIGKQLTLTLSDGRRIAYRVVVGREYGKDELGGDAALRNTLYDQVHSFGVPGGPRTSRLLLVSCGGAFDNATGEYEDNVFLYALPVIA